MTDLTAQQRSAFPDTTAEQAAYWFAVMLDGGESEEERRDFIRWMEDDPSHPEAFRRLERLWSGSTGLELKPSAPVGRRVFIGGSAAVLLMALGVRNYWYLPFADFRTGVGERRTIRLAGGTAAVLSSDTALALVSRNGVDGVKLLKGEAWFDHPGTAGTPFFVDAQGGTVRSSGGCFDVADYGSAVTVIAQKGVCEVALADDALRLEAGRAVQYGDGRLGLPYGVDADVELAWQSGRLVFMGDSLGDVANVLERWQHGRILVLGDSLKARPVTLVVDLDRLQNVLPALGRVLPVEVIRITDYLTVIRDA